MTGELSRRRGCYLGDTMSTTTVKLSPQLRRRVASLAKSSGVSPHAFMVEAIERQAAAAEKQRAFHAEALAADAEMERTGEGFRLEDVEKWFITRLKGNKARPPRVVSWR